MAKTVFVWHIEPGQGLAVDNPDDIIQHLRNVIENINEVRDDPRVKTVFIRITLNGFEAFAYEADYDGVDG